MLRRVIWMIIALMMEAGSTSETLVNIYRTATQHPRRQPSSSLQIPFLMKLG
jgi:hypothetical protein